MILEKDVKQDFLTDGKVILSYDLGRLGRCEINFEQYLIRRYLRADVTVWSEHQGLIGIEIKNQHDNLKRLPRQIVGYTSTCNLIYVITYKNHLVQVQHILHKYPFVGIMVYDYLTPDMITLGLYRPALPNPYFNVRLYLKILWRPELLRLLVANYGHTQYQLSRAGLSISQYDKMCKSMFPHKRPTKNGIVDKLLRIFGKKQSAYLEDMMFVDRDYSPQRHLQEQIWK